MLQKLGIGFFVGGGGDQVSNNVKKAKQRPKFQLRV